MVQNSSLISSFFLLALLAPICEEILCRGIVPKKIFRGKENLGFVVGTVVFALLHQPSNLPSLLIYGSYVDRSVLDGLQDPTFGNVYLASHDCEWGCFLFVGSCGDHESDIRDFCLRFLTIAYLFLLGKDECNRVHLFLFMVK